MRTMTRLIALATLLLAGAAGAQAQTARLQVIHNAADPAAAVVDVYVNGSLLLDDFAFRAATPFRDVPAGVPLNIGVAPGNSDSADDALATFPVTLTAGKRYVAIANGVLDPAGFAPNPDGRAIGFSLYPLEGVAERGWLGQVALRAFHGATDAPAVDIVARTAWTRRTLFEDLGYGDFSGARSVWPLRYELDVTPAGDSATVVATFVADLTALRGGAAVVFASGFLSSDENAGGPAFGLFAALPNGAVVALPPAATTARLQVIHNAADPAAAVVDVWIDGARAIDDFVFRAATRFLTVPAGVTLNVGIAPADSDDPADALATFPVTLQPGRRYVAVASGVLNPSGFAPNPGGLDIAFDLYARDGARERSLPGLVALTAFHGATDAPAVDVRARRSGPAETLFGDLAFGDFGRYRDVPADRYVLDVTPAGDPATVVASFDADLTALGGGAAVVFASGFLSPAANAGGPAFGLFAALPGGAVVELPARAPTSRLQVIHNAADPAVAEVDVYLNGSLAIDDFAFRAATPFLTLPAGVPQVFGIAPGNSDGAEDVIAQFTYNLAAGGSYVAVANGVLGGGFAPNPDGRPIAFDLYATDNVRTEARYGLVRLLAFHGATDAPAVDILQRRWRGHRTVAADLAYGEFAGPAFLPPWQAVLDVTPAGDNDTVVATFIADLRGLANGSAVVFASGFLNPGANADGPAFGLFAALPDGRVVALAPAGADAHKLLAAEGEEDGTVAGAPEFGLDQNWPNPFNPATTIAFSLPASLPVSLKVFNVRGELVETLVQGTLGAGRHTVDFRAEELPSGVYFYRLDAGDRTETRRMMLVK